MSNKKISVIIPVFNGQNYIGNCIKSILEQTYKNFELLVINDGSQDNTIVEVKKFKDERIRLFNKINSGVSDTRNFGISKSTGDYLIFIDADDIVDSKLFERLIDIISEIKVNIIRYNGYVQSKHGKYNEIEFPFINNRILNSTKNRNEIIELINNPSKSIRCYSPLLFMENNNIISFNTDLEYLEDKFFYLNNFLNNKNILFINEKLYYYNYNQESKTKKISNFVKNIDDIINAQNKIKYLIGDKYNSLVDSSTISLIVYRLEYLSSITNVCTFKKITKEVFKKDLVNALFKQKIIETSSYVTLQSKVLKNKMFILFKLISLIKRILKKGA